MHSILITLKDNDFSRTLRAFAELLLNGCMDVPTVEEIQYIWNEACLGIYLAVQNGWNYCCSETELADTKKYLNPLYVWVGAEAEQVAHEKKYDGNGAYVLITNGEIYNF